MAVAQDLTAKKTFFITRSKTAAEALRDARGTLATLADEWAKMNYGGVLVDADFTGPNAHMTLAILTALYTSQVNLETYWGAGNGTNVDKCVS